MWRHVEGSERITGFVSPWNKYRKQNYRNTGGSKQQDHAFGGICILLFIIPCIHYAVGRGRGRGRAGWEERTKTGGASGGGRGWRGIARGCNAQRLAYPPRLKWRKGAREANGSAACQQGTWVLRVLVSACPTAGVHMRVCFCMRLYECMRVCVCVCVNVCLCMSVCLRVVCVHLHLSEGDGASQHWQDRSVRYARRSQQAWDRAESPWRQCSPRVATPELRASGTTGQEGASWYTALRYGRSACAASPAGQYPACVLCWRNGGGAQVNSKRSHGG